MDYYASLGVARTSEDVVIRAAYLVLMRRYHPDGNSTIAAAERVREVTKAYGVLGDPVRRREYDRAWDPQDPKVLIGDTRRAAPVGPIAFGITILCAALLIWITWAQKPSAELPSEFVAAAIVRETSNQAQPDISCSSLKSASLISNELLRQASRIRADMQSVLVEQPKQFSLRTLPVTAEGRLSPGSVACSAVITIGLPRGVMHPDGGRSLAGNIEYFIDLDQTGDASSIQVTADDKLLLDLASLESSLSTPSAVSAREPADRVLRNTIRYQAPLPRRSPSAIASNSPPPQSRVEPLPARDRPPRAVAQPSCRSGDRWTRLICADANLTALNHQMTIFEEQSVANAVGKKRELLQQSRAMFDSNRASCRTEACVQRVIVARTTEVAGIMGSQTRPEQR